MNIYLQNGSLEDRLANQSLPRHLTRFRSNSLQRGLPTPTVAVTAPPFFLFSCWYTRSLCHFFGCFIFHFLRILTFPFSKFFRPSLSLFFSFPNLGLLPLEVFLLGYEQLLGSRSGYPSWAPWNPPSSSHVLVLPPGSWSTYWKKSHQRLGHLKYSLPGFFSDWDMDMINGRWQ